MHRWKVEETEVLDLEAMREAVQFRMAAVKAMIHCIEESVAGLGDDLRDQKLDALDGLANIRKRITRGQCIDHQKEIGEILQKLSDSTRGQVVFSSEPIQLSYFSVFRRYC